MGIPGIQTTNPNQQLTISWYLTHKKKEKNTKTFWKPQKIQELIIHHSPSLSVSLLETNSSPLKMDGWNTTFLLGPGLFSGAMLVSERVSLSTERTQTPPWCLCLCLCRFAAFVRCRSSWRTQGPWVWWWKMSSFSDMKVILSRTWQVGNSTTIFKKKETLDPKLPKDITHSFLLSDFADPGALSPP